jgi:2-hydroxy-3-keto-5-methylthiopentenyl-1-phosphate phosphatase
MHDTVVRPIVFLDFDGTVSQADVVDAILERYADRAWLAIEEDWRAGRIGSRECLRGQLGLVRASAAEVDALVRHVGLDEGFSALLETCAAHALPVNIVSDGFDYCIERILRSAPKSVQGQLESVQVYASHLEPHGASEWRVDFPHDPQVCAHGCATCKPAVMARLNPSGAPAVFIGDGLSDRFAAEAADVLFAKQKLDAYCRERSLPYVPYQTLADVAAHLDALVRTGGVRRAVKTRVRV